MLRWSSLMEHHGVLRLLDGWSYTLSKEAEILIKVVSAVSVGITETRIFCNINAPRFITTFITN